MRKVVGLLGVKGSGKDTCAKFLVDEFGFRRVGFADALYQEVADAFGVTVEFLGNRETKETPLPQLSLAKCKDADFVRCFAEEVGWDLSSGAFLSEPNSPRHVLQLWGTEYRRRRGIDSYWLDKVKELIDSEPQTNFVVTDVRFSNEFNFIGSMGGKRIRVRRPELEAKEEAERSRAGRAAHPSETELLGKPTDAEVHNVEGRPESLREGIVAALQL